MSMGPVLICQNISVVVNVVFVEILAMTIVRHKASTKRVIVQKKYSN